MENDKLHGFVHIEFAQIRKTSFGENFEAQTGNESFYVTPEKDAEMLKVILQESFPELKVSMELALQQTHKVAWECIQPIIDRNNKLQSGFEEQSWAIPCSVLQFPNGKNILFAPESPFYPPFDTRSLYFENITPKQIFEYKAHGKDFELAPILFKKSSHETHIDRFKMYLQVQNDIETIVNCAYTLDGSLEYMVYAVNCEEAKYLEIRFHCTFMKQELHKILKNKQPCIFQKILYGIIKITT